MLLMCQESNEPFDFHTSEWFIITSIHISLYTYLDCTPSKVITESPTMGDFYGTGIEIWAGFGLNGQLSCLYIYLK